MPMGTDLLMFLEEARLKRIEDEARPLLDCPVCGNPLDINARGVRNCDVGHFRTDRTTVGRR